MSLATERAALTRKPQTIIDILMDQCAKTFGEGAVISELLSDDFNDGYIGTQGATDFEDNFEDSSGLAAAWTIVDENWGSGSNVLEILSSAYLDFDPAGTGSAMAISKAITKTDRKIYKARQRYKDNGCSRGYIMTLSQFPGTPVGYDGGVDGDHYRERILITLYNQGSDERLYVRYIRPDDSVWYWDPSTETWSSAGNYDSSFATDTWYWFYIETTSTAWRVVVKDDTDTTVLLKTTWVNWSDTKDDGNAWHWSMGKYQYGIGGYEVELQVDEALILSPDSPWGHEEQGSGALVQEDSGQYLSIHSDTNESAFLYYDTVFDRGQGRQWKTKFTYNNAVDTVGSIFRLLQANHPGIVPDSTANAGSRIFVYVDGADVYIKYEATGGTDTYWQGDSVQAWMGSAQIAWDSFQEDTEYILIFTIDSDNLRWKLELKSSDEQTAHIQTEWVNWSDVEDEWESSSGSSKINEWLVWGDIPDDAGQTDLYIKNISCYSFGNCSATGERCFKTRSTCKDTANYVLDSTYKTHKFCLKGAPPPLPGTIVRPYLLGHPTHESTEIDAARNITKNARGSLLFADETDNDIGVDPYVRFRSTYGQDIGRFWSLFLERNPYYRGRTLLIKDGYDGLSESEYTTSKYILDQIDRNKDGTVKVVYKDLLKRADRVQVPAASTGKVTDNPLTSGATVINYDSDDLTEYPSSGYLRLNNEVVYYSANDTSIKRFTGVTRGQWNTTAAEHSQNTKIQLCYAQSSTNVVDIILDILQNYVGVDASDIDTTGFAQEKTDWLSNFNFTGIVTKPTKASDLLQELVEIAMGNLWWSEEEQLVKFKVFARSTGSPQLLDEDEHIESISIDYNEDSRVSRVVVYFDKINGIDDVDDPASYYRSHINWDADAESASQYNEKEVRTIYSRWFTDSVIATTIASKIRSRFRNPAKKMTVVLERKDSDIKLADIRRLQTEFIVDQFGVEKTNQRYEVIKKAQKSDGKYQFVFLDTAFQGKVGLIAPAGQPDWDAASDEQKEYCYIGSTADNTLGTNDDEGFVIS